ncbi:hypothetical protein DPEC_G00344180 [Dallia pectoralis]|uniref:Uncharacterized protein n=1 Tax=Dallia pectoralis TaxID=75939 RepID=A0ACC2F347_DALPE|nr:hypothetical protein DPEC_G00344180 [Dallia pectoralis]
MVSIDTKSHRPLQADPCEPELHASRPQAAGAQPHVSLKPPIEPLPEPTLVHSFRVNGLFRPQVGVDLRMGCLGLSPPCILPARIGITQVRFIQRYAGPAEVRGHLLRIVRRECVNGTVTKMHDSYEVA